MCSLSSLFWLMGMSFTMIALPLLSTYIDNVSFHPTVLFLLVVKVLLLATVKYLLSSCPLNSFLLRCFLQLELQLVRIARSSNRQLPNNEKM